MRFFQYSHAVLLSVVMTVSLASTTNAQFREITPNAPSKSPAADLVPTKQPFVAPRITDAPAMQDAKQDDAKIDAKIDDAKDDDATQVNEPSKDAVDAKAQAEEPSTNSSAEDGKPKQAEIEMADPFASFAVSDEGAATAPSPSDQVHFAPLAFNQVKPGETKLESLRSDWGDAAKEINAEEGNVLIYKVPGFQQVDVFADADGEKVQSILVHLEKPTKRSELYDPLGLDKLAPVTIADGSGIPLAVGFPERGVLLIYDTDSKAQLIAQVSLEPIESELFVMRVEQDQESQLSRCLKDLERAIQVNPDDHKAYWLQAELMARVGRSEEAVTSGRTAVRKAPANPLYKLTLARLQAENGKLEEGLRETRAVLDDPAATEIVRSRAEYQLGNLMATEPDSTFEEAMGHHLKAVDLAVKHIADPDVAVRRMAKNVLIDAHLAIAQDIALGNFQRKDEVVPKWLTRAAQLAEDLVSRNEGDESVRMKIYRSTLATYSVMEGNFDASIATEEALKEGRRLIAQADDSLYQACVECDLSETLYYASRVEHQRGRSASAMTYASNAVALLDGQTDKRQPSLFDRMMQGQLYFLVGSLYAMHRNDHQEAVNWYEKASPVFQNEDLQAIVDSSSFGDLFVSMGVSYWQTGKKEKAVELTQLGAELMQQAVQVGAVDLAALAVPYGNLAAMHEQLGNGNEAKHFAEMMARVEAETKRR